MDQDRVVPLCVTQEAEKMMSVMMQDVVGDYDDPDEVSEWKWVQAYASFQHRSNGQDGVFEFVLNLSTDHPDVPARLADTLEHARRLGCSYVLFHQGT